MIHQLKTLALGSSLTLLATPALAHSGHAEHSGLVTGLLHPLTGIDHLLAILAIGLWTVIQFGNPRGKLVNMPLASLLGFMTLGAVGAIGGLWLPAMEVTLALTLLILGLLISCNLSLAKPIGLAMIGLFAGIHGFAHGGELVGSATAFITGMLITTTFIFYMGVVVAALTHDHRLTTPMLGSVVAISGLSFLII